MQNSGRMKLRRRHGQGRFEADARREGARTGSVRERKIDYSWHFAIDASARTRAAHCSSTQKFKIAQLLTLMSGEEVKEKKMVAGYQIIRGETIGKAKG